MKITFQYSETKLKWDIVSLLVTPFSPSLRKMMPLTENKKFGLKSIQDIAKHVGPVLDIFDLFLDMLSIQKDTIFKVWKCHLKFGISKSF